MVVGASFAFMWRVTSDTMRTFNQQPPVRSYDDAMKAYRMPAPHPEMEGVKYGEELLVFKQEEIDEEDPDSFSTGTLDSQRQVDYNKGVFNPNMIEVLVQRDPYRYIRMPKPLKNGKPDYRIQKWNNHSGYKDMYLCDNFMQFKTAIQDFEYTKWLDPAGVPCYVKDV